MPLELEMAWLLYADVVGTSMLIANNSMLMGRYMHIAGDAGEGGACDWDGPVGGRNVLTAGRENVGQGTR